MTLHSLRERTLLVAPIRLALGLVWLLAARLAGSGTGPALLAFAFGTFGLVLLVFTDPRARVARGREEPRAAPSDAVIAPRWKQALAATLPSTAGVSVLAAIAVVPEPTLAATLAGISAGLGVAALIAVPGIDPRLHVEPKSRVVYRI